MFDLSSRSSIAATYTLQNRVVTALLDHGISVVRINRYWSTIISHKDFMLFSTSMFAPASQFSESFVDAAVETAIEIGAAIEQQATPTQPE